MYIFLYKGLRLLPAGMEVWEVWFGESDEEYAVRIMIAHSPVLALVELDNTKFQVVTFTTP